MRGNTGRGIPACWTLSHETFGNFEITRMIYRGKTKAKNLIPIHTEHEDYFKQWHDSVTKVELNKTLSI